MTYQMWPVQGNCLCFFWLQIPNLGVFRAEEKPRSSDKHLWPRSLRLVWQEDKPIKIKHEKTFLWDEGWKSLGWQRQTSFFPTAGW